MNGANISNSFHAVTAENAKASPPGHAGPTAHRYQAALERYVEAVSTTEPGAGTDSPRVRLTFPPITVSDVMTAGVVSAYRGALFKEIAAALARNAINTVAVVDEEHKVIGVVSASDLLARLGPVAAAPRGHRLSGHSESVRKAQGVTAEELMTAPAVTVRPTTSIGDAARQLARHRIRSMPVVDPNRVLIGMVSRVDLIKLFLRSDEDLLNDVLRDVIGRQGRGAQSVHVSVAEGVVTLSGKVNGALMARRLAYEAQQVPGVIEVHNQVTYDVYDLHLPPMTHY